MEIGKITRGNIIKECHVYGTGDHSIVWLHGLNSSWQKEGIGKMMLRGEPIPVENTTVYCVQNPDQKDWSKNEMMDIVNILKTAGHTTNGLVGWSQGGMAACYGLFKQTDFWDTVAIIGGKCGANQDYSKVASIGTKVKFWHHEHDPKMGDIIFKVATHLQEAGVDVEGYKFSGKGHSLRDVFNTSNPNNYWEWYERKRGLKEEMPKI